MASPIFCATAFRAACLDLTASMSVPSSAVFSSVTAAVTCVFTSSGILSPLSASTFSAESLVYSTEKVLADNGDKIPDDVKTQVTAAVTELKTALEGTDIEAVKSKQAALNAVAQKIGEAIYASDAAASSGASGAAGPGPGPEQAGPSEAASDEDVVDAEIVDEDEK